MCTFVGMAVAALVVWDTCTYRPTTGTSFVALSAHQPAAVKRKYGKRSKTRRSAHCFSIRRHLIHNMFCAYLCACLDGGGARVIRLEPVVARIKLSCEIVHYYYAGSFFSPPTSFVVVCSFGNAHTLETCTRHGATPKDRDIGNYGLSNCNVHTHTHSSRWVWVKKCWRCSASPTQVRAVAQSRNVLCEIHANRGAVFIAFYPYLTTKPTHTPVIYQ